MSKFTDNSFMDAATETFVLRHFFVFAMKLFYYLISVNFTKIDLSAFPYKLSVCLAHEIFCIVSFRCQSNLSKFAFGENASQRRVNSTQQVLF